MTLTHSQTKTGASPFDPANKPLYESWRRRKLADHPQSLGDLIVEVKDPRNLTVAEKQALLERLRKANMAIYASAAGDHSDRGHPLRLAAQLGATRLDHNWLGDADGLTSLAASAEGERQHYIPYTNRRINWHTDGYYNSSAEQNRSLGLHCVSPAASGGENRLMDHEMAYIHLRDANADFVTALMAADALTIPARADENGRVVRAEETGSVFSYHRQSGDLHMRYTIRKRHIVWKDDLIIGEARACLEALLESDHEAIFRTRLEPGMGLIGNNVLHDRSAFEDDADHTRLIYRARYFDRLASTSVAKIYPDLFD